VYGRGGMKRAEAGPYSPLERQGWFRALLNSYFTNWPRPRLASVRAIVKTEVSLYNRNSSNGIKHSHLPYDVSKSKRMN
jgi:hypothetical protein